MSRKLKNRVGEIYTTNEGYEVEIIEYHNAHNCTIRFNNINTTILYGIDFKHIKRGGIKNPNHPSIFNVGFIGVGNYTSRINNRMTNSYRSWSNMLSRGYCSKYKEKYPSYKDVTVCEEWHNFQNFAQWFEQNYNPEIMEGWHLDKDILVKGNKVYSPDTCCFVPKEINVLLKNNKKRGDCIVGVKKVRNKFEANLFKKEKITYLGVFCTKREAFQAYKIAKEKHIKEVADKWRDLIDPRVYETMYSYKIEIIN